MASRPRSDRSEPREAAIGRAGVLPSAAFTPGPWHIVGTDTLLWVQSMDGIKVVSTSWHSSLRKPYPLRAEAQANARLIAAAPDLLAALKNLLSDHDRLSFIDAACAAIAKAEGRS